MIAVVCMKMVTYLWLSMVPGKNGKLVGQMVPGGICRICVAAFEVSKD